MKNRLFPLFFVSAMSLTACAGKSYSPKDYLTNSLLYRDGFTILQLTDIHMSDKDDQDLHYAFLDKLIKHAIDNNDKIDFIAVTGDLFTFASRGTAKKFFNFLDGYNIPWSVVFGNHDEQTYFSVDWLTNYLNNFGSYCYFKDLQDDNVQGNCNFAVNLVDSDNKIHDQLIFMDSNRYSFGEQGYMGYDYFKDSQIKWYSDLVDYTASLNEGNPVNSLMFYHIPLFEINDAWEKGTLIYGEKREKTCPPEYNSGFFDVIKEKGSTKAMFFGHDHINNFEVDYEGVKFCYGMKSTDRIYYADDMLGYKTIKIANDHSITVGNVKLEY